MKKLTLIKALLLLYPVIYSQQSILVLKKKNKPLETFWNGSTIAFQLKGKEWKKGAITKIQNDSFYIRPMVVTQNIFNPDTVYFNTSGFLISEIYSMPKRGVLVDYKDGKFQIIRSAGHQHWYWIKSGWLFRIGAAGYAGLNILNGLVKNNFSISDSKNQLIIAAAVFMGGIILHKVYKVTVLTGKKYQIKTVQLGQQ
ncbi:MAG TPA: hypothetical protein VK588_00405 [Chitinophagaceae bacterium]|nr:hypothetical protein [Chitinophagaceae bacterium]